MNRKQKEGKMGRGLGLTCQQPTLPSGPGPQESTGSSCLLTRLCCDGIWPQPSCCWPDTESAPGCPVRHEQILAELPTLCGFLVGLLGQSPGTHSLGALPVSTVGWLRAAQSGPHPPRAPVSESGAQQSPSPAGYFTPS